MLILPDSYLIGFNNYKSLLLQKEQYFLALVNEEGKRDEGREGDEGKSKVCHVQVQIHYMYLKYTKKNPTKNIHV